MKRVPAEPIDKELRLSPRRRCADAETARRADCLNEEIDFWRGMLATADGGCMPAETVERMTFALALAEFRLRRLSGQWPGPPDS